MLRQSLKHRGTEEGEEAFSDRVSFPSQVLCRLRFQVLHEPLILTFPYPSVSSFPLRFKVFCQAVDNVQGPGTEARLLTAECCFCYAFTFVPPSKVRAS